MNWKLNENNRGKRHFKFNHRFNVELNVIHSNKATIIVIRWVCKHWINFKLSSRFKFTQNCNLTLNNWHIYLMQSNLCFNSMNFFFSGRLFWAMRFLIEKYLLQYHKRFQCWTRLDIQIRFYMQQFSISLYHCITNISSYINGAKYMECNLQKLLHFAWKDTYRNGKIPNIAEWLCNICVDSLILYSFVG